MYTLTNLFVFIKNGGASAPIPPRDLQYCAENYAIPTIDIIKTKTVICLGAVINNTIRRALGYGGVKLKAALEHPARYKDSVIYGVPHTGGLGVANAGGNEAVEKIWGRLADLHRQR